MSQRLLELLETIVHSTQSVDMDLKEVKQEIVQIKVLQAIHNEQLTAHMARTAANEAAVDELKKHSYLIQGFGILLTVLSVVATIYAALR